MAEQKKTPNSSTENPADALGADEVQAKFDEAAEKGYFGSMPDETPNENYTLKGVTSDKPTPENQRGK
jgi:hypothetical protein